MTEMTFCHAASWFHLLSLYEFCKRKEGLTVLEVGHAK